MCETGNMPVLPAKKNACTYTPARWSSALNQPSYSRLCARRGTEREQWLRRSPARTNTVPPNWRGNSAGRGSDPIDVTATTATVPPQPCSVSPCRPSRPDRSAAGSSSAGRRQRWGGRGLAPLTAVISMKPSLSLSYKFEKEEEGGKRLEEEEEETAPLAMIPGSATAAAYWKGEPTSTHARSAMCSM